MAYRGLVLDLDGTVLREQTDLATPEDRRAIRSLIARGVPVVVATGRTWGAARPVMAQLGIIEPAAVLYGAQICDPKSGEAVLTVPLEASDAAAIAGWAAGHGLASYLVKPERTLAFTPAIHPHLEHMGPFELRDRDDPARAAAGVLQYILPVVDEPLIEDFIAFAEGGACADMTCYFQGRGILCTHGSADKAQALGWLAQRRGWDLRSFVAIGDDPTDLCLFDAVGMGIAAGSRHDAVASAAAVVADPASPTMIADAIASYFS